MSRIKRSLIWGFALGAAALSGWIGTWLVQDRRMDCQAYGEGRAGVICGALADNMQFGWLGHAIISPGYKVTFETVRRVYCQLNITPADLPALEELLDSEDWRLQNGGDFLLRLTTGHDRFGTPEDINSIFNPGNPGYILKDGCGA